MAASTLGAAEAPVDQVKRRGTAGVPAVGVLTLGWALVLAACTAQPDGVPSPAATPSSPAATPAAAPQPTLAPLPDPATTGVPVVAVEATRGPAAVGTVELRPGALWISLDCVADERPGDLAVILGPQWRIDLECPADEVYLTRNLDQDHLGGPSSIRVETGADVRWSLLIEQ
jgi:hypothetical protein